MSNELTRNPDDVNPNWERPDDWPFPEDWNSASWKKRMAEIERKVAAKRERYGFVECPKCGCAHTTKTLMCRECGWRKLGYTV